MARTRKYQVANIDDRSCYFRLLLYPDNPVHADLLESIVHNNPSLFSPSTVWEYIGIQHFIIDDCGEIIVDGEGKRHYHIYLRFKFPMWTKSLCRRFGFFTPDGLPDDSFVRVIQGKFENALVYLTHLNSPDKEQYGTESLFGSPDMIRLYEKAALSYTTKKADKRDIFADCQKWIASQPGIISAHQMLTYLIKHQAFAIRNEPWLRSLWSEHNSRLAYIARKEVTEAIARDAEKWADILQGGNLEIKPDEWFDIQGGMF